MVANFCPVMGRTSLFSWGLWVSSANLLIPTELFLGSVLRVIFFVEKSSMIFYPGSNSIERKA